MLRTSTPTLLILLLVILLQVLLSPTTLLVPLLTQELTGAAEEVETEPVSKTTDVAVQTGTEKSQD